MRLARYLLIVMLICLLAFNTASAQTDYPPMAAFTSDGRLFVFGYGDEPIQLTDTNPIQFSTRNLAWHPDGRLLAFTESSLRLYDPNTDTFTFLQALPFDDLPIAFAMDSNHLIYAAQGGQSGSWGPYWKEINSIELNAYALPEERAQFAVAGGYAGGGFVSPAQSVYEDEIGFYFGFRILEDTPLGIFHYTVDGLHLSNAPEGAGLGSERLHYGVTSPNRTEIATPHGRNIRIIDLATQEDSWVDTEVEPELLAWNDDEVIFYTTIYQIRDLYGELSTEAQVQLNKEISDNYYGLIPDELPYNEVSIRRIDLSSGDDQEIYRSEAYAIGSLMPSPNGTEVYFSTVPNLDKWVEEMLSENLNCADSEDRFACNKQFSHPSLFRLNVATGETELIGEGLYRATINFAAMSNQ